MARVEARPVLDLPDDVRTVEGWRGVLADLTRQEAELEAALERVREERRQRAFDIARGAPAALRRNAELNAEQVEVLGRLDLLTVVRGAAQEKLGEAEAAEAAAEAAARRERLQAGAETAKRLAAEWDVAARRLTEASAGFREAVTALIPHGLDSGIVNKLRNRTKVLGALHAAGLHEHVQLDRVAAPHQEALRDWAGRMLAHVSALEASGAPEPVEEIAA